MKPLSRDRSFSWLHNGCLAVVGKPVSLFLRLSRRAVVCLLTVTCLGVSRLISLPRFIECPRKRRGLCRRLRGRTWFSHSNNESFVQGKGPHDLHVQSEEGWMLAVREEGVVQSQLPTSPTAQSLLKKSGLDSSAAWPKLETEH